MSEKTAPSPWQVMRRHGARLADGILWVMLRIAFIECTRKEVADRAYAPSVVPEIPPSVSEEQVERARTLFEDGFRRRDSVNSKVTTLLTMAGVIIPLTVALVAVVSKPLVGLAALIAQMWAVLLLVSCLGVERVSTLSFLAIEGEAEGKHQIVKDYLRAASINEGVINFIVDAYRGALRSFVVASLMLIVVVGASAVSATKQPDPVDALTQRLKTDQALTAALRGPPGPPGPVGPKGPPGDAGTSAAPAWPCPWWSSQVPH